MELINEYVIPYWPFIAFVFVTGVIAQVLKANVLTVDLARKYKVVFWLRRLFPIILIVIGAVVGLLWKGEPSPGVETMGKKALYFMGSSCVAITMFSSFKNWIKKKLDVKEDAE